MTDRKTEIARATQRLAATWGTFIQHQDGADLASDGLLIRRWAENPFPWWNVVIVPGDVSSAADLRASLAAGAHYMRTKRRAGSIRIADEQLALLGADRTDVLAALKLSEGGKMTEMAGTMSDMQWREPEPVRFERIAEQRALCALADINADAYGMPSEVVRAGIVAAPETWITSAYSYLAYERDRLVSAASVLPHDGWLYVAFVATAQDARRRGLAASTISHALKEAYRETGIDRTDMHASDMGIPVYRTLGYRPTVAIRSLLPVEEEQS